LTLTDPIPQHVSLKLVDKNKLGMEANIIEAQKKAVRAGYSAEIAVHHKLKANYESALELSDDLRKRSQKMFFVSVLLMFSAPSLEELDRRESTLCSKARKITSQLQTLTQRQQDGFSICLPLGVPSKLAVDRALTSESTAVFIPFSCQELFQVGGFYYGLNGVSRNLILLDRTKLPTPSGFVLGMSGSGKSFAVKREMLNVLLRDSTTPLLIIDPENEYTNFVKHFGGECIKISANSDSYINPMEMSPDYGLDEDDNPETVDIEVKKDKALRRKSDYLLSIINRMLQPDGGNTSLTPQQKTFIDSCITECYKEYLASDFDRDKLPSLKELQAIFDSRKGESDDARLVAEGTAYFTTGSMDVFSHQSNVDLNNRIVCFGIRELGDQLRQIALQIVLDFIWNKMTENSGKKTRTYCYADEIHVLFKNRDSASFLQQLYKRGRKYGLVITGITQDIGDLLKSEEGCGMVYNSDFLLLLRQAPENLRTLAPRLNLSEAQCSELTTAAPGSGILKAGSVVVPFRDKFPKTSYLYKLISTNFNELEKEKAGETVKNGAA
jgi:type IV secretory pathway VirB4 component